MPRRAIHRCRRAVALIGCAAMTAAHGMELSIDRLFEAPALAGPRITGISITADNSRVLYLRGKDGNGNRLDLWEYDVAAGHARVLVDADALARATAAPSAEELSRRERQRTAALSGVLDYSFIAADQSLLVPVDGRLFLVGERPDAPALVTALIDAGTSFTDARVSPQGGYVAYVHDQNLYVRDLRQHVERALTHDGGGAINNGMAEFVAQEEMDRHTGYWWSADDRHVAFARVDEAPVHLRQRFEITADDIATYAQRYPAAGEPNATVTLGVVDVITGAITWIDLGTDRDIYLARVQWLPDGRTLAIQRQSRDQRRLELLFADIATGRTRLMLTETSGSWIDLNDELTFLRSTGEFIWASSRDGFVHLYLYSADGHLERRLTAGAWNVVEFRGRAIKAVNERQRLVYFVANERSPLTRDLYAVSLDTKHPDRAQRITQEPGLHAITMAHDFGYYVDRYTSRAQPPQVSVRNLDGSLRAWIEENALDRDHPYAPYAAGNSTAEFGSLVAADGQSLYYQLFRPRDFDPARRYPAIVSVYGGPAHQEVLDQWRGDTFTQVLTRAGYVVFQLDNRGTAFRGTAFQAPLTGRLGGVEVDDQVLGARWLGAQPYVDPHRVGVSGWSYGGYMALMLMFRAPDVFRAGIAGAPVTDWSLYDTHYTERYLGKPQDHPQAYAASSVLGYAGDLQGRLLVMHGMADDNVLFSHSTRLLRRLQDLGKPFDVMVYPGAKHGLTRQDDGRHAYATILEFFNRWLR